MVWQSGLRDCYVALRFLDHLARQSVSASWCSSRNYLLRSASLFASEECEGKLKELFVLQMMNDRDDVEARGMYE